MDIGGLITSLLSGSAITYFLGWLAGRKRYKADLEGIQLKNVESIISIYQKVQNDLKNELTSVGNKCTQLIVKVEKLTKKCEELELSNRQLTKSNLQLTNKVTELNKKLERYENANGN